MLTWVKQREKVVETEYYHEFRFKDDPGAGCSFPCDKEGNINFDHMSSGARQNFEFAVSNPDKINDLGIIERNFAHTEPAIVKDECGVEFALEDQHGGACSCPKCNRWYNLFGQELNPPEHWNDFGELDGDDERW